nr:serine/threonine protein kinase SRPK1 [Tanacetum cinerariifolium]
MKRSKLLKENYVSRSKEKVIISSDSEESEADDFSELKKITALLAKAFNRRKFYTKPTNNNLRTSSSYQSANKKQEFVKTDTKKKDKDEQVLLAKDQAWMESSKASSSSADEKISEVSYYLSDAESESEFETLEYYDNSTNYGLFVNNDDDQEIFHDAIKSASENFIENHIDSQKDYEKSNTVHMIMPSKDNLYNGRKGIGFENPSYFEKAKDLRPTLYDEKVIGLGYTPMFLTHSDKALEIEKFKSCKSFEKEKANLETTESLKSKGFESSENVSSESENQTENDCLVVEKECDKEENLNVIAPEMFKLNVSQCYLLNDYEDVGKFKAKGNIGVFVGYLKESAAFRIYNKRTQYEKFSISDEKTIDSDFTRFSAIVTSLKSLDQDYSSKNHVRKFLCALPLKWRANVMTIKEAKELAILLLDELISNLKVYEMILENDGIVSKNTIKEKGTSKISFIRAIGLGVATVSAMVPIGSEEAKEIVFETKEVKAKDKGEVATVAAKKVTLLVSVQSPKKTRPLLEELGVIVKTARNLKMMQHVSWKLTLKRYNLNNLFLIMS